MCSDSFLLRLHGSHCSGPVLFTHSPGTGTWLHVWCSREHECVESFQLFFPSLESLLCRGMLLDIAVYLMVEKLSICSPQ